MLSNTAPAIREMDRRHYLHPWEGLADFGRAERPLITHGEGIFLWDAEGRRYIDGPGGMWCVQAGYGRSEITQAVAEQMQRLPYASPWSNATEPAAVLAAKLAELAPAGLNTVQFTTGGSTAVDTALRTVHFVNNRLGRPEKKIVLAREKGYHGSTYLAASASGKERDRSSFDIASDLVHFLPDVASHRRPKDTSIAAWCDAKVADLEQAISTIGADRIGAFIAEPVLCSGGVLMPPDGYHQRTFEICRAHDILYISDEVVTAFGRLGHWFASESVFGIEPDFITCAKGLTSGYLPLGACLIHDRVIERITGPDHDVLFPNGYTYSGHPVSCAAALANIELFEREGILEHVRQVAPHFLDRLSLLGAEDIIADARGIGLVGCLEGGAPGRAGDLGAQRDLGARLDLACEKRGLIVRPLIDMCVFSPPLIITKTEIDEMMDILEDAVREVSADISAKIS